MPTNSHPGRRDFLKTAAAGAAGAMGVSALKFDKIFAQSTGGWVAGMQINPAIDNKRVICCHDTKMLTAIPANQTWASQNANVDEKQVGANLDQMAMLLTNKTAAADAWSTIFRSSKPWGSTKVAMKTNGIGSNTTNRPRVAIYKKITDVLVDQLGVQPSNIILYDNCDNATTYYSPSMSLTDSTKIRAVISSRAAALGGFKAVTLTNAQGISCAADLVDGNIDILVNVAACKSHNGTGGHFSYGSCTLCMKNHLGTFTDGTRAQYSDNLHVGNSGASPPPPPLALFEINKHSAVLGGNPVRQQICIVDALVSNGNSGPGGGWDNKTDRLVMGTFAPIVDYLAANKILLDTTIMSKSPIPALGVTNAAIILPMFLTQFGYAEADPQWIEYTPDNVPVITLGTGGTTGTSGTTGAGGSSGRGGSSAAGGTSRAGGTSGSGGVSRPGGSSTPDSGGTTASGGGTTSATSSSSATSDGGSTTAGTTAMSSSAGGSGGAATTAASASGGSTATGGTSAGHGTTASAAGGSSKAAALEATHQGSSGGCSVVGADRRSTPWGAMLAVGAVVAGKLRRWTGG